MLADWCSHRSADCPPGIAEEDFEELAGTRPGPDARLGPAGGNRHWTSVFGQAAQLSGMNLYVRLNTNRAMAGEPLMADSPVAFQVHTSKGHTMPFAYLRLTEMDPTMPFEVQFYDAIGKNLYSGEERLRLAVWLFSLLAVLLSLVGIWGQVLMDVQYKRMEISVQRVFGADMGQITSEGLMLYLRTVAICYVIAAPVGWLVVRYYLQQFSHQVGFLPSVFLLALVIVGVLCAIVMLYHYLKTARTNPAEALKNE